MSNNMLPIPKGWTRDKLVLVYDIDYNPQHFEMTTQAPPGRADLTDVVEYAEKLSQSSVFANVPGNGVYRLLGPTSYALADFVLDYNEGRVRPGMVTGRRPSEQRVTVGEMERCDLTVADLAGLVADWALVGGNVPRLVLADAMEELGQTDAALLLRQGVKHYVVFGNDDELVERVEASAAEGEDWPPGLIQEHTIYTAGERDAIEGVLGHYYSPSFGSDSREMASAYITDVLSGNDSEGE